MKKKNIRTALDALKTIKMPKIEDKELRNGIINDHFTLLKAWDKYEKDVKNLETAHLGPFEEERQKVGELQQKLQTTTDRQEQLELSQEINSHEDLFKAINAYHKAVSDLGEEEVKIKGMDRDKFMDEIAKQDFNLGLIEALYPMFTIKEDKPKK